jgi:Xaa-Pro aminopeptidase
LEKRGKAVKSDMDGLMSRRGLDAIVVLGGTEHNPIMHYVTGGANLTSGIYVHKRDKAPHLVHSPIERDQAAATGLEVSSYAQHDLARFLEKEPDEVCARAAFYRAVLGTLGVGGRVAFYGKLELSQAMPILQRLNDVTKEIELVSDSGNSVFDEARSTKEPHEVDSIRSVGERCQEAMGQVLEFLRLCKADGGFVVDPARKRVTLGRVKDILRTELMRRGLVESKGSIVAMGSEAAVPHNYGTDSNELRVETPLIMDVFPSEFAGGYHFDITRTFCLGEAPPAVRKVYQDVMEVQMDCISSLKVGERGWDYQSLACDLFEKKGYETLRQNDKITEGYVHNLGHGIGLEVHERPRLAGPPTNTDVILPGSVFTIEPGLYFTQKAIAARLEDIIYAKEDGSIENLTTFPKELEIPLR